MSPMFEVKSVPLQCSSTVEMYYRTRVSSRRSTRACARMLWTSRGRMRRGNESWVSSTNSRAGKAGHHIPDGRQ